ncbi:MAG: AAA family ATPase [Spirochaetaceae bacterium]|nr:AAA family ATPase [Spirochaetaceae bacterium]
MADRIDFRRWNVTRVGMEAWRNFSRQTEIKLRGRTFFVGPNASGKSNILDALRFLRDVAGSGLDEAVALRGGMREVRSLHARQFPGVRIAVDVGPRDGSAKWSYELHFRNHPNRHRPVVERECVRLDGKAIVDRPDKRDRQDAERLTQTHLEQVSENQAFWRAHGAKQSEAAFSDGTLRLLGLFWALAESGGPLLLEEPELSLHDALVSRLATLMARMNRKSGRQVLVTTHSAALLGDKGIDLAEVYLLVPGEEGTNVLCAADLDDVRSLVEGDLTPGEAIMPRAAPKDVHQLSFDF